MWITFWHVFAKKWKKEKVDEAKRRKIQAGNEREVTTETRQNERPNKCIM